MHEPIMMQPAHEPAPALSIPGLTNFRDVGGIDAAGGSRVRSGQLFRSDSLAGLPEEARAAIDERGIGQVIDLRSVEEIAAHGRFDFDPDGFVRWRHCELGRPPTDMRALLEAGHDPMPDMYRSMTTERAPMVISVLQAIADSETPTIVHCTSGKDRTGVAIAITLRALGVSDHVIEAEYLASNQNREHHLAVMEERYRDMATMIPANARLRMAGAEPEWLAAALEPIDAAGGVDRWIEANGGSPDLVDRLRSRLIEVPG